MIITKSFQLTKADALALRSACRDTKTRLSHSLTLALAACTNGDAVVTIAMTSTEEEVEE